MNEFSGDFYNKWRQKRFAAILAHYGRDFFLDKTILELGAANGDFGNLFYELGCKVICLDVRQENVDLLKIKHPHLEAYILDLDNDFLSFSAGRNYDLILNVGVLYHLIHIQMLLQICFEICNDMVLETEVMDSDQDGYFVTTEDASRMTSSRSGIATRPTNTMLKRIIREKGWSIEYPQNPKDINTKPYIYDWEPNNQGLLYGARVLWFLSKKDV
jgi:2-polyprenyl-3-methyl-5-hydroxy-6-metoxy-1,4-benzoquinol methylase